MAITRACREEDVDNAQQKRGEVELAHVANLVTRTN